MSVLRIPVRLARRRRTHLPLAVIFQGRVFALFRRVLVRTSGTARLFRIR